MKSPGLLLAAVAALSLALTYVWPSTQWAAERAAVQIAEEQCRVNKLDCETEAKPRKPKDFCEGAVGSRPSRSHLVSAPQWRI